MFGLGPWLYNFSQIQRSEITLDNLTSVPSPYTELAIFGFFKAAEVLSFIGGCIVHPIYRLYLIKNITPETATNNTTKIIRETCRKLQGRFLLASFLIGPLGSLAYVNYYSINVREAKEVCYQIRCNEKMMVWDRTAVSLGLLGWYWKRFKGAVDGVNIASAYAAYYFTIQKPLMKAGPSDKLQRGKLPKSIQEMEESRRALPFLAEMPADSSSIVDLGISRKS